MEPVNVDAVQTVDLVSTATPDAEWTGGFFAGMMWQFHRRTGDPKWRERAEHYSRLLEHRQHDRNVHDLGFIFLNTYLPRHELADALGRVQLRGRE